VSINIFAQFAVAEGEVQELEGVKKCWGQPAAANVIIDKQGVRDGRLWQSPIVSQLPVPDLPDLPEQALEFGEELAQRYGLEVNF
jgi:hypothetical protein